MPTYRKNTGHFPEKPNVWKLNKNRNLIYRLDNKTGIGNARYNYHKPWTTVS